MSRKVGVIGAGMTRFVRRAQDSPGELAAQAVQMALDDAGMTIDDIDAVCLGTAPDAFDGVHMKGEHLIAGAGGTNKPYLRHYVGGGTGVMSLIHGWMHVASGKFDTCLVVCEEKMSPCNPHPAGAFLTIFDRVTEQPLELTLIHIFALEMARFMHAYGYTERDIAAISVNNKRNALDHPAAQVAEDLTVDDVMNSKLLSWPVKRLDISPTSDAAVAIVMTTERIARARKAAPVWIEGVGYRLDTAYWCTRDLAYPNYVAMAAMDAYKMAGIVDPYRDIDIFEPYDPFDYKALHHMNALLLDKTGRRMREIFDAGEFARDGSHPLCPSGGALGVGNPIAATGLMKIAELYFQLSGQAGKRQVKKSAHRGVAQAWGDLMQVGTVVVMGSDGAAPNQRTMWTGMEPGDLGGHGLKSLDGVTTVADAPDLSYWWDNGEGITNYLAGLKNGKIRGSYDRRGNRMMIPARTFSEIYDLAPAGGYFDLPDTGTVMTYTISHVNWDSSPLPDGKVNVFAVIAIDTAGQHMGLVHRLGEVDPANVKIGMRVRAVWKPADQRIGNILDIDYFRPAGADDETAQFPKPVKPVEFHAKSAGAKEGKIPLTYKYTTGVAGSAFVQSLLQGKILATWSEAKQQLLLPPTTFDEYEMESLEHGDRTCELDGGEGYIESFSVVYEDRTGHELSEPKIVVQVGFPGVQGSIFGFLERDGDGFPAMGQDVELIVPSSWTGPDDVRFRLKG